jgi:hypothetical protein
MPESIALAQLKGLLADGVQLVHVLPPEEYAAEHLPGAVNVPLKQLDAESGTTGGGPGPGHDACAGRSAPRCPHVAGRSWQQTSRASRGSPRATGGLAVSRTRPRDLAKGPHHERICDANRRAPLSPIGWPAMSARELFARRTDELPGVDPVVPVVVVDDDLLPPVMALVEPAAFVLDYPVAACGPHSPKN